MGREPVANINQTGDGSPDSEEISHFENFIKKELTDDKPQAGITLLKKFYDCFTSTDGKLGQSNIVQNKIDNANDPPSIRFRIKVNGGNEH